MSRYDDIINLPHFNRPNFLGHFNWTCLKSPYFCRMADSMQIGKAGKNDF